MKNNTFLSSGKVLFGRVLSRTVHFSRENIDRVLLADDGKEFKIIRDLSVDPGRHQDISPAVFVVRFKFSGLPLAVNKHLSMIPVPFLVAMPEFRWKIWAVSDDRYFQGVYQWASKESAESYPQSFIFKMMTKRAKMETVSYEIIPDMYLKDYIDCLITM